MCLHPERVTEALSECIAGLWVAMMADYSSWSWIQRLNVVHQLPSIGMSTEAVYCNHVTSDWYHVSLAFIHEGNFRMARLESSSESSRRLISDET